MLSGGSNGVTILTLMLWQVKVKTLEVIHRTKVVNRKDRNRI
jgi:hypothetical protein